MKKQLVIANTIIVFLSLFLMLLASSLLIYKQNYDSFCNQAKNYLSMASSIFDGTNYEKTATTISKADSNIRLTIIDKDGNVIIDTDSKDNFDNHLQRKELQPENLGKVFKRVSKTENKTMLYVASFDNDHYIRIAIPVGKIAGVLEKYILGGVIALVIILSGSLIFILILSKYSLKPVNLALNKLSNLAEENEEIQEELTIDNLPMVLENLNDELNEKIKKINEQKDEIRIVLDLLDQGVVLIDKNGKINLTNDKILEIFNENTNIIGKNYIYLCRDINLQKKIEESITNKKNNRYILKKDGKTINCVLNYINDTWLFGGLIITFDDITNEENINKTKRDFFQNASHELKSPLTSIIGYQQMITEHIVDSMEQVEIYSKKTLKEANRMNNIIIDMLDLSSLEQSYVKKDEKIELNVLILEIVDSFEKRIKDKNIKVELNLENTTIIGDNKLIDELIRNIVDNSIKYNVVNGEISIILKNKILQIKDSGIGISEDDKSRVFERFYRVDKGRSKDIGGTGLGLSIVKHICEVYDYKLTLSSLLGKGTIIKIDFN